MQLAGQHVVPHLRMLGTTVRRLVARRNSLLGKFSFAACLAVLIAASTSSSVRAYTPESLDVQQLVQRAVGFLRKDQLYDEPHRALAAMAMFKAGEPISDPFIQKALKDCAELCRTPQMVDGTLRSVYQAAVVGLFLCEVDPKTYQKEIQNVMESMEKRQKPFGGWGYPKPQANWETGDTSMTQYAVLFAWLARSVGAAELSRDAVRKVTNWLVRTQDPQGAWGYQGRDPGVNSFTGRVEQSEVRHSLAAAGLGSLYICSGILGITEEGTVEVEGELPAALRPITEISIRQPGRQADGGVNADLVKRALRDGDKWYQQNYRINPPEYTLYYLYTLERYQSFREIAEGKRPREPRWYNDGVRFLMSKQERDGSWDMEGGTDDVADTSFGIMFLMRSAQKAIQKSQDEFDGLLIAGRGLPGNTKNIRVKKGKIVTTPFQGTANSLLAILDNTNHPDFDSAAAMEAVPLSDDPREAEQQQIRLRRMVSAEAYKTRMVAVKSLSKIRNLDNVPALVYALSDPDARVMRAARDGLRFHSRKFAGFGLGDDPSQEERQQAIKAWKDWYLSIRPDALFLEN